jgi:hypothetical protein
MIVIELCGGLGNQLFQYSFGLYLKNKLNNNSELYFDDHWFRSQRKPHEVIGLEKLGIKFNYIVFRGLKGYLIRNKIIRKIIYKNCKIFSTRLTKERGWDGIASDNTYYVGFWQSALYTEEFNHKLKNLKKIWVDQISNFDGIDNINEASVCVHVRRGDYLTNKNLLKFSHRNLVQDIGYYADAMKDIYDNDAVANFHIFSDDIDWCRENFDQMNLPIFYWNINSATDTFKVMLMFTSFIISASTFSWWPAYINKNISKKIVYPENYILGKFLQQ